MRSTSLVIVLSLASLAVCFWNRKDVPENLNLRPETADEPRQTPSDAAAFAVRYSGTDYTVEPKFKYELTGVVVSFRHHDGRSRMHSRAGDHLNMLDVCVIWGANAEHPDINQLDFWNGIFTCNVKTRDRDAWARFDMNQLSNNHLISDDEAIRDAVTKVAIGDQIRIRGFLASYSGPGGTRGTSTTRSDTGDGACETIYVRSFDIMEPALNYWRSGMYGSLMLLIGGLAAHFRRPYRPYRNA